MTPQIEGLLQGLKKTTDCLLQAARQQQENAIDAALSERQRLIDELSVFLPLDTGDPKVRALADDILRTDKLAVSAMKSYFEKMKAEVSNSEKKYEGMKRYFSSGYDLAVGQLIDRKR